MAKNEFIVWDDDEFFFEIHDNPTHTVPAYNAEHAAEKYADQMAERMAEYPNEPTLYVIEAERAREIVLSLQPDGDSDSEEAINTTALYHCKTYALYCEITRVYFAREVKEAE